VTFVTGHAKAGEAAPDVNWAAFAAPTHTVVVYMGSARAKTLAQSLIAGGRREGTPALIIENGTRPDQRLTPTTLAALAAGPDALETEGPALLIVGEVTAAALQATIAEALRQAA
jgi:siroheme synthase